MNYFYIAKKSNYFAGYLNVVGSVSWLFLILVIYLYHFLLLIDTTGNNNYAFLAQTSPTKNDSLSNPTNSVQETEWYAYSYIQTLGYQKFFAKEFFYFFFISITFWHCVFLLFLIAVFCFVLKTVISLFTLITSIKAKSMLYFYLSLMDLFIPLVGGCMVIYINKCNKKIIAPKVALPLQWIKFKAKNFFFHMLKDNKNF